MFQKTKKCRGPIKPNSIRKPELISIGESVYLNSDPKTPFTDLRFQHPFSCLIVYKHRPSFRKYLQMSAFVILHCIINSPQFSLFVHSWNHCRHSRAWKCHVIGWYPHKSNIESHFPCYRTHNIVLQDGFAHQSCYGHCPSVLWAIHFSYWFICILILYNS